jgi:hypothetical protein
MTYNQFKLKFLVALNSRLELIVTKDGAINENILATNIHDMDDSGGNKDKKRILNFAERCGLNELPYELQLPLASLIWNAAGDANYHSIPNINIHDEALSIKLKSYENKLISKEELSSLLPHGSNIQNMLLDMKSNTEKQITIAKEKLAQEKLEQEKLAKKNPSANPFSFFSENKELTLGAVLLFGAAAVTTTAVVAASLSNK